MSLRPVFTAFDRAALPTNLLTVADYRTFGKAVHGTLSWETAARKYAEVRGGAVVLRGDDSLVVFTKLSCGKIRRTTYKSGEWGWA